MATQKKNHNTAITSVLSWKECLKTDVSIKEKTLVLKYLKEQDKPCTSRQISKDLQKERTNITRSLNDLVSSGKISVSKIGKCNHSGRRVGHYSINQ